MNSTFRMQRAIDRLPWRIAKHLISFYPPSQGYYCFVISTKPAIVLIPDVFCDERELWRPFFATLARKRVHFICWISWGLEAKEAACKQWLPQVLAEQKAQCPEHHFTFLANNSAQQSFFEQLGIASVFVNHNALVNERIFTIHEESIREYDAIYNAVMMPYKRHHLASKIGSLALATYLKSGYDEYVKAIATTLKHATWLNFPSQKVSPQNYQAIPRENVPLFLNRARVGLCLSEHEGAMFASMEYLLCGLPIVSTPSIGGRDVFFDKDYVEIVEPDPHAVKEAVIEMVRRRVRDPKENFAQDRGTSRSTC